MSSAQNNEISTNLKNRQKPPGADLIDKITIANNFTSLLTCTTHTGIVKSQNNEQ